MIKQSILPAIRNMKDFEKVISSQYEYMILLDSHITQIKSVVATAKKHNKKILIHMDMIDGLKNDESGTLFVCQEIKPAGIISTKRQAIITAKKKGVLAIQRLFSIDTLALENGLELLKNTKPDYIEVLPGIIPEIIREVHKKTDIKIIAGGLVREKSEIESALKSGAISVSTSNRDLWEL
ncbi:glycerol-3-phosphate responsive antiterminator [Cytobacillus stercorigallinarum]|uniref:glycerol-3-phosphate responsive antiterminator n=1 Tax=Cytobacillus TaxID=2675230 RepID=UPI00384FA253